MNTLLLETPKLKLLPDRAKPFPAIQFPLIEVAPALSIEAIHERAETITPLLEEILRSRPAIRWGTNE